MANLRRLPVPNADLWDWQLLAQCRDQDSAIFFHPDGERGSARANREARAKEICGTCPVLLQCRDHALAVREPYGVWGGLSPTERKTLIRAEECDVEDDQDGRAISTGTLMWNSAVRLTGLR
jgi:WhiB family redox-sensing transcriptional regulator